MTHLQICLNVLLLIKLVDLPLKIVKGDEITCLVFVWYLFFFLDSVMPEDFLYDIKYNTKQ